MKVIGTALIVAGATFVLVSFQDSVVQGSEGDTAPQEAAEETAEETAEDAMMTGPTNQTSNMTASNMTAGTIVIEE